MSPFPFVGRHRLAMPILASSCVLFVCGTAVAGQTLLPIPGRTGSASWFTSHASAETMRDFQTGPSLRQATISNHYGVGVISTQVSDEEGVTKVTRLDTTWVTTSFGSDTLRLGDSVNRAGTWGRPLRFGGLQYGTNLRSTQGLAGPERSPSILGNGLVDRAVSAGFLRSNYGVDGDRYGPMFASATLRSGVLDNVTTEVRGSAQREVGNGGVALHMRMYGLGVFSVATAASRSDAGLGRLAQTGFEYRGQGFVVSVGSQWTSPEFRQLGIGDETLTPRQWSAASASYDLARYGAFAVGYSALADYSEAVTRIVQGTYRVAVGRFNALSLDFSRTLAPEATVSVMMTLSFPLDHLARKVSGEAHRSWGGMQLFDRKPIPAAVALSEPDEG